GQRRDRARLLGNTEVALPLEPQHLELHDASYVERELRRQQLHRDDRVHPAGHDGDRDGGPDEPEADGAHAHDEALTLRGIRAALDNVRGVTTDQLAAAADAVALLQQAVDAAARHLASVATVDGKLSVAKLDEHQVVAYDLAHAAAATEASRVMSAYGERGEIE